MGLAKPPVVCIITGVGSKGSGGHKPQEVNTALMDPAPGRMPGRMKEDG
jgi:hypothetical protein